MEKLYGFFFLDFYLVCINLYMVILNVMNFFLYNRGKIWGLKGYFGLVCLLVINYNIYVILFL